MRALHKKMKHLYNYLCSLELQTLFDLGYREAYKGRINYSSLEEIGERKNFFVLLRSTPLGLSHHFRNKGKKVYEHLLYPRILSRFFLAFAIASYDDLSFYVF
jgi:hypothetical protein